MSPAGFRRIVERAGKAAKLAFNAHPLMLRHACGYKPAKEGKDTRAIQLYKGHRSIDNTVIYTAVSIALQGFLDGLTGTATTRTNY